MSGYNQKTNRFDYKRTPTSAKLRVTMPDGSLWDVPVQLIADNRDRNYADEDEDTIGYIRQGQLDPGEITDWAANNMNWEDVSREAVQVAKPPPKALDLQEGWMNGEKEIVGKI